MSATTRDVTTVEVSKDLHQRLERLKPYSSVSFNDLIEDMADTWEANQQE